VNDASKLWIGAVGDNGGVGEGGVKHCDGATAAVGDKVGDKVGLRVGDWVGLEFAIRER